MTKRSRKETTHRYGKPLLTVLLIGGMALLTLLLNGARTIQGDRQAPEVAVEEEKVEFLTDLGAGFRKAAEENKPVLLFFMEENCPYSRRALETVFTDREVLRLSRRFVCVQIDVNRAGSEGAIKKYHVTGSPTIQFLSTHGNALQQVTDLKSPSGLSEQMETILYSVAWRQPSSNLR